MTPFRRLSLVPGLGSRRPSFVAAEQESRRSSLMSSGGMSRNIVYRSSSNCIITISHVEILVS